MDVICGRQVLVDHGVTTVVNYRTSSRALHTIVPLLSFDIGGLRDYEEARDILPVSNLCSAAAQRTGNISTNATPLPAQFARLAKLDGIM
jgi:hypothetical protein